MLYTVVPMLGVVASIVLLALVVKRGLAKHARLAMLEARRKVVKRAIFHWQYRDIAQAHRMIQSAGNLYELDLEEGLLVRVWEVQKQCTNSC